MPKSIKINDIANEVGLSRNTVSKALNGLYVPEKTKKIVLEKAIALGYKSLNITAVETGYLRNQKILLLTTHPLANLNFFMFIIKGVESTVSKYNFELLQYTFNPNTTYRELNNYIKLLNLDGIICIETFDEKIVNHLLSLEIPTVFLDFCGGDANFQGKFDIVMMENIRSVGRLCEEMIHKFHKKTFGFVGDFRHCRGFYERFLGMKEAMFFQNLPFDAKMSLTLPDNFPYGNPQKLKDELAQMGSFPEVFVCANDSIAISLIKALKLLNKRIPEDIAVIGFDDIAEGRINLPTITTVRVDKEYLGKQSLDVLLNRIKHPNDKNRIIYVDTLEIYRESTPGMNSIKDPTQ